MSSLFDVICPSCQGGLSLAEDGVARCGVCGVTYLVRMGHLVPVSGSSSPPPERSMGGSS